jgi:hypothetical protein
LAERAAREGPTVAARYRWQATAEAMVGIYRAVAG